MAKQKNHAAETRATLLSRTAALLDLSLQLKENTNEIYALIVGDVALSTPKRKRAKAAKHRSRKTAKKASPKSRKR